MDMLNAVYYSPTILEEDYFSSAERLLCKLKNTFSSVAIQAGDPGILDAVRSHLCGHLILKETPFEIAVNTYLKHELALVSNILIDNVGVEGLWENKKVNTYEDL